MGSRLRFRYEGPHRCHAALCDKAVPPRLFMCFRHWRRLQRIAPELAQAVQTQYKYGQENNHSIVTRAYVEAAHAAIEALARDEVINGYET